jgi:hypothetical protein
MFKRMLFSIFLLVLIVQIGVSQSSGLGLGLALGNPTGIDVKGWLTRSGAIHLGIGWPDLGSHGGTALSAEYLWHSHVFRSHERFPLFYGIGGFFGVGGGTDIIAARGILGIEWWPRRTDLDIFLQLMPALYFEPTSEFDFDFQVGIRYFF